MFSRSIISLLFIAPAVVSFTAPVASRNTVRLYSTTDEETETAAPAPSAPAFVERGVSMDQDGKSNVWAIEPKMEVSSKSSEENTQSAIIAGAGLVGFAVVAGGILANLPDPNQF